jgi:RND family efflux transporter MFP subunit
MVTERLTDPGNLATPGVPLVRIESLGAKEVVVRVDEARVAFVRSGDAAAVAIESAPGSAAGLTTEGVVAEVAHAVGPDQRAFTVKVSLPRSIDARSGRFARVFFRGAPRRALVIPASAVQTHGQVSSVFVVQDGRARLRLIQTGQALPDRSENIEVLSGLEAGESVVTRPSGRLADGVQVSVGAAPGRAGGS